MKYNQYKISAKVWLYPGRDGWHFVSVPRDTTEDIKARFDDLKRGWSSLPVNITIGRTSFETSIFPDNKSGTYLLPLKAEVRKKEGITADTTISFLIEIRV